MDRDNKLIYEAYLTENSEEERYYNLGRDAYLDGKDLRDINPSSTYGPMSYAFNTGYHEAKKKAEEEKTYEFKVSWPNIHGTEHSRHFDITTSTEPTEEQLMQFVADKVKEQWEQHGEMLSNNDKEKIPDPMAFRISRGPVAYGRDEDRGAVGFRKGGRPLHGG